MMIMMMMRTALLAFRTLRYCRTRLALPARRVYPVNLQKQVRGRHGTSLAFRMLRYCRTRLAISARHVYPVNLQEQVRGRHGTSHLETPLMKKTCRRSRMHALMRKRSIVAGMRTTQAPFAETPLLNDGMPIGVYFLVNMLMHVEKLRRHRRSVTWLVKIDGDPHPISFLALITAHVKMALRTYASIVAAGMVKCRPLDACAVLAGCGYAIFVMHVMVCASTVPGVRTGGANRLLWRTTLSRRCAQVYLKYCTSSGCRASRWMSDFLTCIGAPRLLLQ